MVKVSFKDKITERISSNQDTAPKASKAKGPPKEYATLMKRKLRLLHQPNEEVSKPEVVLPPQHPIRNNRLQAGQASV